MNKEQSQEIILQTGLLCANAQVCYANEDMAGMDEHLCQLRDVLDDVYDRNSEEAQEEQQPETEQQDSTKQGHCVPDQPHETAASES